jgi:hypothetical protein
MGVLPFTEWKTIVGYEGRYGVSNTGLVKSIGRFVSGRFYKPRWIKEKLLVPILDDGYYFVNLCKDGKWKKSPIHRLVAQAFHPNPENFPEVNHLDGVKTNNLSTNLEWTTRLGNASHASRMGLYATKTKPA